ncbi:hypothetical protein EXN66_Car002395 [Channa argus]|uniref:Uncharacterized protein n=2 Tax=Channa argus TaxID=215402 RepID=A0A6G1P950_CHAAH|nr:hypothetical protein EXN66_Car002395 [Channa argus]
MKNLLAGIILGLLAVVHSAYVNNVILTEPESDELQESIKDEFLILPRSTELPKRNVTTQFSSHSSDHKKSESSPAGDNSDHTQSVTHAPSFASIVVTRDKVDSRSDVPELGISEKLSESTPANAETLQKTFLEHVHSILPSELGSGEGEKEGQYPATSSARSDVITVLSASTAPPTLTTGEGWNSELGTSAKFSESTPTNEKILGKKILEHVHSILPSELGSGEGEKEDQYPATSSARPDVITVLSASTAPPTLTVGEGWNSELGTSEKFSESTPTNEKILGKKFLKHVHSILPSELGSGEGEKEGQYPATSSARPDVITVLSASTAPPTLTAGEGWNSELGTSAKFSESTPTNEKILGKKFLEHVHSILPPELGSGEGEKEGQYPATSSARPDVITVLSASTTLPTLTTGEGWNSELGTSEKLSDSTPAKEEKQKKLELLHNIQPSGSPSLGNSTPRWIIILAFLVGVAVLVIVGVAIATREKWIGPNQVYQLETQTNSSNQQREAFLNKDKPKENGKAAEYTIIPLDELPQSYTSN